MDKLWEDLSSKRFDKPCKNIFTQESGRSTTIMWFLRQDKYFNVIICSLKDPIKLFIIAFYLTHSHPVEMYHF